MPNKETKLVDVYEAWVICECGYIGDSWWGLDEDGITHYFCKGCKQNIVVNLAEDE